MASNPPARCCTVGLEFDGTPTGKMDSLPSGTSMYVATPSTTGPLHKQRAILYIPDVIGVWQNAKIIADQYAARGYFTVIPDVFRGDPIPLNRPEGFDLQRWLKEGTKGTGEGHGTAETDPVVQETVEYLQRQGYTAIGGAGYCFGAKYVARFMAAGKGLTAGFFAHPSFVDEEELRAIQGPLSIAAAGNDHIFTVELRQHSEKILREVDQPFQITLYSGVAHGFSVRGDTSTQVGRFAAQQAFAQAAAWFDEFLNVDS